MVKMEEGIKVLAKRNVKLVLPALATMHRDTWTLKVLETHPLFFKDLFIYLFITWLSWVFIAVQGLSLVVVSGASSCGS